MRFLFILYLGLLQFIICQSSFASSYYVSTTGLDTNAGSFTEPFATIQHGSNQLQPGDSLLIRDGIYFEKIYLNVSGNINNQITIAAYNNEIPIIDGTGVSGLELLTIHEQSNVVIDGLNFQNNFAQFAKGIFISSEAENIAIKNCNLKNIGWTADATSDPYSVSPTGQAHGIIVNGRTTLGIRNIEISDCIINNIITGNSEALTLVGNVSNFELNRNTIYNTTNIAIVVAGHYSYAINDGVDILLNQSRDGSISNCVVYNNRRINNIDAPAGIYADGASNVIINNNISYQNGNGISVGCENAGFSADSITVVNNLVYNNDNQGIIFGSNAAIIYTCTLKNNTFLHNGSLGNFYTEVSLQNSENCMVVQNILLPKSISHYAVSIFGYTATNLLVDNNLAYRYDGTTSNLYVAGSPAQFSETNSLNADPFLVDTLITNPNVHLQSISPAINKGFLNYGNFMAADIYNEVRLVNGIMDLGASENENGACPQMITIDSTMILSGNFTASDSIIVDINGNEIEDSMKLFAPYVILLPNFIADKLFEIKSEGCEF